MISTTTMEKKELGMNGKEIAFAIEQPADVDVNDIVIRPTAQG